MRRPGAIRTGLRRPRKRATLRAPAGSAENRGRRAHEERERAKRLALPWDEQRSVKE